MHWGKQTVNLRTGRELDGNRTSRNLSSDGSDSERLRRWESSVCARLSVCSFTHLLLNYVRVSYVHCQNKKISYTLNVVLILPLLRRLRLKVNVSCFTYSPNYYFLLFITVINYLLRTPRKTTNTFFWWCSSVDDRDECKSGAFDVKFSSNYTEASGRNSFKVSNKQLVLSAFFKK